MAGLERHDRQRRIAGWNQEALASSPISVIGDDKKFTSLYVLSAAALGINNQVVVAPDLDRQLINIARQLNPDLKLAHLQGYFVHREMKHLVDKSKAIVDLTGYNLAKKLLVEQVYSNGNGTNLIMTNLEDKELKIFNYSKGREFKELEEILADKELPGERKTDSLLALVSGGLLLEETKNVLMGGKTSDELVRYTSMANGKKNYEGIKALVIGAGALGNAVGLGLGYLGVKKADIIDPDDIEETNLNRQILFYGAVGRSKSLTLANRLNGLFGMKANGIKGYFRRETNIGKYDIIFDCVDNFETRIVTSEKCKEEGKRLISGGTSFKAGQVVVYNPKTTEKTPAEFLGLYEIVSKRKIEEYKRDRASCTYTPDPSVIMSNQIIGGLMVDKFRALLNGNVENTFYDADSGKRLG